MNETCSKCGKKVSIWKALYVNNKTYCSEKCCKQGTDEIELKKERRLKEQSSDNIIIKIDIYTFVPYDREKNREKIGFPILQLFKKYFDEVSIGYIPDDLKKSKKLVGIDICCFKPLFKRNIFTDKETDFYLTYHRFITPALKIIERVFEKNEIEYKIIGFGLLTDDFEDLMNKQEERMKKGEANSMGFLGDDGTYSIVEKRKK